MLLAQDALDKLMQKMGWTMEDGKWKIGDEMLKSALAMSLEEQ